MPDTTREDALVCWGRIRTALRGCDWPAPEPRLRLTASTGLVSLDERESVRELAVLADARLCEAKAAGRDRIAA